MGFHASRLILFCGGTLLLIARNCQYLCGSKYFDMRPNSGGFKCKLTLYATSCRPFKTKSTKSTSQNVSVKKREIEKNSALPAEWIPIYTMAAQDATPRSCDCREDIRISTMMTMVTMKTCVSSWFICLNFWVHFVKMTELLVSMMTTMQESAMLSQNVVHAGVEHICLICMVKVIAH